MIIDCVADLHGYHPKLEGGDLLIIAGDLTTTDTLEQHLGFLHYLAKIQDSENSYKKITYIAGNHDAFLFPESSSRHPYSHDSIHYLSDSGIEFEGLKIWGTPWSPLFKGVNPNCKAFMLNESKLQKKFEKIPSDVDILISHSPPYLILDANKHGEPCGSMQLRMQLDGRIKPKVHVFGHIHEQGGKKMVLKRNGIGDENNTTCYNVSYVNEKYQPINAVRRIIL